jgi:outer membrane protein OmpA-like peptidoglycan-associated protein
MARTCLAFVLLILCTAQVPSGDAPDYRPWVILGPYEISPVVYFAPNATALTDYQRRIISQWAWFMEKNHQLMGLVAGYADDPGNDDVNDALSARRAEVVRQALIELGIPASRLRLRAYGSTRPLRFDATPEAHASNRRVALTFPDLER